MTSAPELTELAALVEQVDDAEIGKAVRNLLPHARTAHDLPVLLAGWLEAAVADLHQQRRDGAS